MKTLDLEQMEVVNGGEVDMECVISVIGLAGGVIGGLSSMATLNPLGMFLGAISIHTGLPLTMKACGLV